METKNRVTELGIYQMAIQKFGNHHQVNKAIEELSKLIVALTKDNDRSEIISRITDIGIMCNQLKIIYGITQEELAMVKDFKLKRLENIINERSS